jgi:ankyrin repeat protein
MLKLNIKTVFYLYVLLCFSYAFGGSYDDYFYAIENDDHRVVAGLLARGFDPNTRDERGQAGLFLALREGSLQVAEVLASHPQLQLDASNASGETPLMMAALRGNLDWCRRMLDRGAKADFHSGWTPLHYAATGPDHRVVQLLLDRGAAIDALSPERRTPLMMAALYGSETSVGLLLSRGANAALRDAHGRRAADLARGAGRDKLADRLERATR